MTAEIDRLTFVVPVRIWDATVSVAVDRFYNSFNLHMQRGLHILRAARLEELARFLSLDNRMARVALNDLIEEGRVVTHNDEYRLAPSALGDFDGYGSMFAAADMVQKENLAVAFELTSMAPLPRGYTAERVFAINIDDTEGEGLANLSADATSMIPVFTRYWSRIWELERSEQRPDLVGVWSMTARPCGTRKLQVPIQWEGDTLRPDLSDPLPGDLLRDARSRLTRRIIEKLPTQWSGAPLEEQKHRLSLAWDVFAKIFGEVPARYLAGEPPEHTVAYTQSGATDTWIPRPGGRLFGSLNQPANIGVIRKAFTSHSTDEVRKAVTWLAPSCRPFGTSTALHDLLGEIASAYDGATPDLITADPPPVALKKLCGTVSCPAAGIPDNLEIILFGDDLVVGLVHTPLHGYPFGTGIWSANVEVVRRAQTWLSHATRAA